ncbi:MAG: glycoside hydrolase family 30 beta sandwich domain-containing protein [Bacteroidota bacterium]|nr:glycoside hydrolase family 30 beta sandwich domain-containing protein [Bacteroidota bacterium]
MRLLKAFLMLACMLPGYSIFSQTSVNWWLTSADKSALLTKQVPLTLGETANNGTPNIIVTSDHKYQSVDGFGFALTGGSAQHMIRMSADERKKLIQELFGKGINDIGISYLRVTIGASDLNDHVFSYDDVPAGQTDVNLEHFTLKEDEKDVIPVLKEILAVNPDIKILGSPWSGPVWMKSNNNIQGGRLKDEYYPVYAKYFVKYIKAMQQQGIAIDAITVQNEPFNDGNTPSMQFLAKEEANFIKKHLGPAFKAAGIKTKIILYDHNCDAPEYPISILTDPEARQYIDGSGFHLYAGPITALSKVHDAFPDKNLYFTEMMAVSRNDFNVANPVNRILIGAMRNWSRNVILWNLAADPNNDPHTDNGGCTMCQGAITIDGDKVSRNLAYYTIAHATAFVPSGSVRVESSIFEDLTDVAFETPEGKTVLIVANRTGDEKQFTVSCKGKSFAASLKQGSVATYVW